MSPFKYISQMSGKQIRSQLSKAFNFWLKLPEDILSRINTVVDMLHNAGLMIDDIEDNSILRRGVPVTHKIYGVPLTINSANYIYFLALQETMSLNSPKAVEIYTEQLLALHRGQALDIYWRDTVTCPTEEQYTEMVLQKTGGLFFLAIRLMQLFSDCERDCSDLLTALSIYFQIRDDYCNLQAPDYFERKSYAEDLTEGKFSYPIIHAIRTHPEDDRIINILRQKPSSVEVKRYAINLMVDFGSFDYTKKKLIELEAE